MDRPVIAAFGVIPTPERSTSSEVRFWPRKAMLSGVAHWPTATVCCAEAAEAVPASMVQASARRRYRIVREYTQKAADQVPPLGTGSAVSLANAEPRYA